ncbi:MAG: patatin-like phospholipase family protein [Patescibacteria group bacterium]|nr:patatin-like phospholipase family protein [Patescibacteria group bacterium]
MKRILSIDGGGIFGLIPAAILSFIEHNSTKPSWELFDLIAGTSTGGIIACGLGIGVSADELVTLYRDYGSDIFSRDPEWIAETLDGMVGPKYPADDLEKHLKAILGDRVLSSALTHLLIPAYQCDKPGPLLMKSWKTPDFRLWQAARATSAAETYFPAMVMTDGDNKQYVCADGGTYANNPSLCAYASARELWPEETEFKILSLGTGASPDKIGIECVHYGLVDWAPHISGIFMNGMSDTVSYIVERLPGVQHLRVNTDIPSNINRAMDDAEQDNIDAIYLLAESLVNEYSDALKEFMK